MQVGSRVKYAYATYGDNVGTIEELGENCAKVLWDGTIEGEWQDIAKLKQAEEPVRGEDQVLSPGIHINESKIRG